MSNGVTLMNLKSKSDKNISYNSKSNEITDATPGLDFEETRSLGSCHESLSSMTTSLCRICQSETGAMIRPCACAGTMGKIHEKCLNEWVMHSKKECCEICQADYAKSGNVFLPLREWNKPKISSTVHVLFMFQRDMRRPVMTIFDCILMAAYIGLMYSIIYILFLFDERQFLRRLFVDGLPPRETDTCRIILFVMLFAFFVSTTMKLIKKIKFYFRRQCKIRFVNSGFAAKNSSVAPVEGRKFCPANGNDVDFDS